jgi:type II secretory pathway component GspD/PulD (secretin)
MNMAGFGSSIGNMIQMLVSNGAANINSAPRIVTTNNREGSILDGDHLTYVARYSSYGDVYETQDLNTGLSLTVTPSIGDNDYITLDMEAKFTALSYYSSGSPVESGQILNNHVIVKNNEAFLLGAFKQRVEDKRKWHFPLLGRILPYIFSNTYEAESERDVLLVVTPKIIDQEGSAVPEG